MKSKLIILGTLGIVFLLIAVSVFFVVSKGSGVQFAGATNEVKFISEDTPSLSYEITATPTSGTFLEIGQADYNNGFIDAHFGVTTSSDSIRRTPHDVPEQKFISNVLIVEGLTAQDFSGSSRAVSVSDVRVLNPRVECTPQPTSNIRVPNTAVKDNIESQMFSCKAFADLKAYYPNGTEATHDVKFYGGTSARTQIIVLKNDVDCTENQLSLCGSGNFQCLNNKCVESLSGGSTDGEGFNLCTQEIKLCPDGSYADRNSDCSFKECSTTTNDSSTQNGDSGSSSNDGTSSDEEDKTPTEQKPNYVLWASLGAGIFLLIMIIVLSVMAVRKK